MQDLFESMDRMRRQQGQTLERKGFGPQTTPSQVLLETPRLRLHSYGGDAGGALALIVPAPIKRHYIWDMAPPCSVVAHALRAGLRPALIEWKDPIPGPEPLGLAAYGKTMIGECIAAMAALHGDAPVVLMAHSLGGVLAVIYAAVAPQRVAALVLIESPLHFDAATGSFRRLLQLLPAGQPITALFDAVPGSVLNLASMTAAPYTFGMERFADLLWSLLSREATRRHRQVERWTLDEAPMAPHLFEEVLRELYQQDRLYRGTLEIDGETVGPSCIGCPILVVHDPRSRIIPTASVLGFQAATASANKCALPYEGDIGVGLAHVGALVGDNAHRRLWPRIFEWLQVA